MITRTNRGVLTLPAAIIVAGALIAVALIWINRPEGPQGPIDSNTPVIGSSDIRDVTSSDHIFGNPNAPIKLIEYSDLSCPYCKLFHPTMEALIANYGPSGNVAWIFRHFPLYKPDPDGNVLHTNAGIQAEALECVGALGGNTAFFAFAKKWFNDFPDDGALRSKTADRKAIDDTAAAVGVEPVAFNSCMETGRFKDKISQEYDRAIEEGVSGTPFLVIVTPSGNKIPLSGLTPYSTLKSTIDTLVSSIPATSTRK